MPTPRLTPFTGAAWSMAAIFLFAVAVQVNDPDPWPWILVYSAAASVSSAAALTQVPWPLPGAFAILCVAWGALLLPPAWGGTSAGEILLSWQMKSPGTESAREALGLAIVAAWMAILTRRSLRSQADARRRPTSPESQEPP